MGLMYISLDINCKVMYDHQNHPVLTNEEELKANINKVSLDPPSPFTTAFLTFLNC